MIDSVYKEKQRKYEYVFTVKEMMKYLKISKSYAYQILENNEVPVVKFGRTYRILKEDLDEFCRRKRVYKSTGASES